MGRHEHAGASRGARAGPEAFHAAAVGRPGRGAGRSTRSPRSMSSAGFKAVDGQRTDINGLDAHVGLYQGSISGVGRRDDARRAYRGRTQRLHAGRVCARDGFARVDREIDAAIQSFRPLTAARSRRTFDPIGSTSTPCAPATRGNRLRTRGRNLIRASELAIMNNHEVNVQPWPASGSRLLSKADHQRVNQV